MSKNAGGDLGDEDRRPPPRLPAEVKGKVKKLATKKRKYADADTERAAAIAAAAERVERGGAQSGVVIADQLSPAQRAAVQEVKHRHGSPAGTAMLGGRHVAIDESQPQGESQQQAQPAEQTEQTQEGVQSEEIEQAP